MARTVPEELLLDTVASLRMADRLVQELATTDGQAALATEPGDVATGSVMTVLLQTYSEIAAVHDGLRRRLQLRGEATPRTPSNVATADELMVVEKRLLALLAFLTRTISAADHRSASSAPASQSGRG